jgi:TonB family protein
VVLKLWIDERGKVDSVEVESSNLPEAVAGTAAAAFGKLRFAPGEIDGTRVRALMRIEVAYSMARGRRLEPN